MKQLESTAAKKPSIPLGTPIYVRYSDHVLFRDSDPGKHSPWVRECIGWLDYQDTEQIRILWERFAMPDPPNEARQRATGLVILRKEIVEMRRL